MGNYVKVAVVSDFKEGTKKRVNISGQDIMVAKVGNNFYAVGNRCPHLGGDLSSGPLEGTVITCPRHGSKFDIKDGKNIRWLQGSGLISAVAKALSPAKSLPTYKVKVEGDTVSVEI